MYTVLKFLPNVIQSSVMSVFGNAVNMGESSASGAGAPTRVIGAIGDVARELRSEGATSIVCSDSVKANKNGSKMILFTVDGVNYIVNTGRSVNLGDSISDLTFGEFDIEGNTVLLAYKPGSADVMTL